MTAYRSMLEGQPNADLHLDPGEYRLLADLLLGHLRSNNLQDERLENLVDQLYVLAVRAVHPVADRQPPPGMGVHEP